MDYNSFLFWKEKCFLHPQNETTFPVDWKVKFPETNGVIAEIGFGNGAFLKELAVDAPQSLVIGFDISMESCVKAIKLCMNYKLENVCIIQNNAKHMLRELFSDNNIDKVYMNFPDPWPKKKHKAKRTIQEDFLDILAMVLKMNGEYELVTDQDWYAEESRQLFDASPAFKVECFQKNPDRPFKTKYERKWLAMKRDVFRLLVKKEKHISSPRKYEGDDMPHVNLKIELSEEKIMTALKDLEVRREGMLFKVKEIYKKDAAQRFLLKTISVDGDQQQKFFIVIQQRTEGWLVKLDDLTQPFRTPAVKFAVFEIGRILNKK